MTEAEHDEVAAALVKARLNGSKADLNDGWRWCALCGAPTKQGIACQPSGDTGPDGSPSGRNCWHEMPVGRHWRGGKHERFYLPKRIEELLPEFYAQESKRER